MPTHHSFDAAPCIWDRRRGIDDVAIEARFTPQGGRWVLGNVEEGGENITWIDPRSDTQLLVIDGVVIDITCRTTFRVQADGTNLVGGSLTELESAVGRRFVEDDIATEVIFNCDEVHLSCVAFEGVVQSISLADFEPIVDGPDPIRGSGAG